MTTPTEQQGVEMLTLVKQTHAWIDSLQIAGVGENTIVTAMQHAVIERLLRSAGVEKSAEYLQSQADVVHSHGSALLAAIVKQER